MHDLICRQAAIDALGEEPLVWHEDDAGEVAEHNQWRRDVAAIKALPSAQLEIIYCKDCVKHNKGHGYYYDGTVIGIKDCCPLVEIRGRAQGHEFDYQFCAYAERRTDG